MSMSMGLPSQTRNRGDVDDAAAGLHVVNSSLDDGEHRDDIDIEGALDTRSVQFADVGDVRALERSIVHEHLHQTFAGTEASKSNFYTADRYGSKWQ